MALFIGCSQKVAFHFGAEENLEMSASVHGSENHYFDLCIVVEPVTVREREKGSGSIQNRFYLNVKLENPF